MTDWKNIRLVIFDLDGTLYSQAPVRICMFLELLVSCSFSKIGIQKILILKEFRKKYELYSNKRHLNAYHTVIKELAKKYDLKTKEISEIIDEWLINRPLKYIRLFRSTGIEITFNRLRALGIKTAIFSNYPTEKKIAALKLNPDIQISPSIPQLRYVKPDPDGINIIQNIFCLEVKDILLIGDRQDHDGECARAAKTKFLHKTSKNFFLILNSSLL